MTVTSARTIRRGTARMNYPGNWQIGIYEVARTDAGDWSAAATGPGTIGDGYVGTYRTLDAAHVALTGESFMGKAPAMVPNPVQQQQAKAGACTPARSPRISPEVIAAIVAAGFTVYMRDRFDSWLHYTDGKRIGYLQCDGMGCSISTVHKPNRDTGTGYRMGEGYAAADLTPEVLAMGFAHAPGWAFGNRLAPKYRDMADFIGRDSFNGAYQHVAGPLLPLPSAEPAPAPVAVHVRQVLESTIARPNVAAMPAQLVRFERVAADAEQGVAGGWWVHAAGGRQSECFVQDGRADDGELMVTHPWGTTEGIKSLPAALQLATRYALAEMHLEAAHALGRRIGSNA